MSEGFAVLPALQNVEDQLCPEGNGHDTRSQMRGLEAIFTAQHNGRDPNSSLQRWWISVYATKKPYGWSPTTYVLHKSILLR